MRSPAAMSPAPAVYSRVSSQDASELARLFERAGSGCYCRYWHFSGDKNAWLDRLANAPNRNASELSEALLAADSELLGVVARRPGQPEILGWLKISRADCLPKLYAQRLYRDLPCFRGDRRGVFSIGCLLVDPSERRRGIARGLLREGLALSEQLGAQAIEAFPRRSEPMGDEERWTGPFQLFVDQGFEVVHELSQYPVLRRSLGKGAGA